MTGKEELGRGKPKITSLAKLSSGILTEILLHIHMGEDEWQFA